jgi:hypothetical protein
LQSAHPGYLVLGNRGQAISKPVDLVQGILDPLILKIVALAPLHGLAIANRTCGKSEAFAQALRAETAKVDRFIMIDGIILFEQRVSAATARRPLADVIVRIALGASAASVVAMVIRQGLRPSSLKFAPWICLRISAQPPCWWSRFASSRSDIKVNPCVG